MFIEIGAGFYNTEDIRWIQKWGGESITIAFKGENDANAMDIEFESEEATCCMIAGMKMSVPSESASASHSSAWCRKRSR